MTERKILSNQDALNYIRRALAYADIEEFDTFEITALPEILEAYDKVEPLGPADVRYITDLIICAVQTKKRMVAAMWN